MLKDRTGQTAFAVAMNAKDNEAASAILSREPSSAEQVCQWFSLLVFVKACTHFVAKILAISLISYVSTILHSCPSTGLEHYTESHLTASAML